MRPVLPSILFTETYYSAVATVAFVHAESSEIMIGTSSISDSVCFTVFVVDSGFCCC